MNFHIRASCNSHNSRIKCKSVLLVPGVVRGAVILLIGVTICVKTVVMMFILGKFVTPGNLGELMYTS